MACKELGLSKDDAKKMYSEMYYQFDLKTPDEAKGKGFEWYRSMIKRRRTGLLNFLYMI